MKTYDFIFRDGDNINESSFAIRIKTSHEIRIPDTSNVITWKETEVPRSVKTPGVDIIII